MNKKRKNYDESFKRSAVKLVVEEGRKVVEVARNLGVHENQLHRWKKEYLDDPINSFPGKGHLKPFEEEIRKLKKQLKSVTTERDILKKAVVIFSKKPERDTNG